VVISNFSPGEPLNSQLVSFALTNPLPATTNPGLPLQLATCHLQLFKRPRSWPVAHQLREVTKDSHPNMQLIGISLFLTKFR